MKITAQELREIIKEELDNLQEQSLRDRMRMRSRGGSLRDRMKMRKDRFADMEADLDRATGRIADDPPADKLKRLRSHKPSNKVTKPGQKLDIHGNQYTAGDPSAPLAVKAIYAVWDENKGAIPYAPNKPDPRSRAELNHLQVAVMKLIEQGKINPAEVERIMKSTVSEGIRMKITTKKLRQIIREEVSKSLLAEEKITLSMDVDNKYKEVMDGDPFDYEYDEETDTFTVKGLNAKGKATTGSRRKRYDRAINKAFGKKTRAYEILMGRMTDAGYKKPGMGDPEDPTPRPDDEPGEFDTDPSVRVARMTAEDIGEDILRFLRRLPDPDYENLLFIVGMSQPGDASVLEDAFNAAYPDLKGSFSFSGLKSALNRDLVRAAKFMLKSPTPDTMKAFLETRELLQNSEIMNRVRMLLDSPEGLSDEQKASVERIKERTRPSKIQDYFEKFVGDFVQERLREKTPFPGLKVIKKK